MSRSVTVAVAYIMSSTTLNWKEALKVVRAGRSVANPNMGFQKQLQDFEDNRLTEERRRLKERFPSFALIKQDEVQCALMLNNYDQLLLSRNICEGNCTYGENCPTGVCRKIPVHQSRCRNRKTSSSFDVPRTYSTSNLRPRSSPAGLRSYTGSAPPSRTGSRIELSKPKSNESASAPVTPRCSPPVSPKHIYMHRKKCYVLKEDFNPSKT